MTLKGRSKIKTNINGGFHDHDFLYATNTHGISKGNIKGDIPCFVQFNLQSHR